VPLKATTSSYDPFAILLFVLLSRVRYGLERSAPRSRARSGINRTHMSNLKKGASYPRLEIIAKLATVLEVEPAELPCRQALEVARKRVIAEVAPIQ